LIAETLAIPQPHGNTVVLGEFVKRRLDSGEKLRGLRLSFGIGPGILSGFHDFLSIFHIVANDL
jgi:hypothetical protein